MWSLGCVAAELFLGQPLYPGSSEYDQVNLKHLKPRDFIEFFVSRFDLLLKRKDYHMLVCYKKVRKHLAFSIHQITIQAVTIGD